jgi:hypothetical protein
MYRARLFLSLALPFTLVACAAQSDTPASGSTEDQVQSAPALVIAIGNDGRLSVPAFGGDPSRYAAVDVRRNALIELRNDSDERRVVVVKLDGPPMLDPAHEVHTETPLTLAPGGAERWTAPPTRGTFTFLCTVDGVSEACPGITIAPATAEPDWSPRVRVNPFF